MNEAKILWACVVAVWLVLMCGIATTTCAAPYVRKENGITIYYPERSYSQGYEDEILMRVKDPEARQRIGVVFGALYQACARLHHYGDNTKMPNPEAIRDSILQEAHIDLVVIPEEWRKQQQEKKQK
jgi:hypothetical protein